MNTYSTVECFRAWCSGEAYPVPNKATRIDDTYSIAISVGKISLGCFKFKTKSEYEKAVQILKSINKEPTHD